MKEMRNLQQRLQEYNDCFAETDPFVKLQEVNHNQLKVSDKDNLTELALKYLSLAILYGIEKQAESILFSSQMNGEGQCKIMGKEEIEFDNLPLSLVKEMQGVIRCMSDLESESMVRRMVCGMRDDQIDIYVAMDKVEDVETITLNIPKMVM